MFRKPILLLVSLFLAPPAMAEALLPVEIVTVDTHPLTETRRFVGTVEASNSYDASFRRGGRITEIVADVGESVAAGEVIARVDGTQARAQEQAARAALRASEAALKQSEQARDRAALLLDRGVGTKSQLDEAEQGYETALSSRDQARAQLSRAMQAMEDTTIRALEDSLVIERMADVGEVAGAGQTVFRLASRGRREAVFQAPDLGGLSAFRGVRIELSKPGSDRDFPATISEVSPVLSESGTVDVRALIPPEANDVLAIGDIVEGNVRFQGEPVVQVPWTALTATANGPAVWIVDPESGKVALREIVVAAYTDTVIGVAEGLEPGERVVGAGSQDLYEGRAVEAAEVSE